MPGYIYSGENHDWDLVLRASNVLLQTAQQFSANPEVAFSSQTGCMLLAYTAVESFTASMALKLHQKHGDARLHYARFQQSRGFWTKVNAVCAAAEVDSRGEAPPFDVLKRMHQWRNALVHSQPHRIDDTSIDRTEEVHALHEPFNGEVFPRLVNQENAAAFFRAALDYVELLEEKTGLKPQTFSQYQVV